MISLSAMIYVSNPIPRKRGEMEILDLPGNIVIHLSKGKRDSSVLSPSFKVHGTLRTWWRKECERMGRCTSKGHRSNMA